MASNEDLTRAIEATMLKLTGDIQSESRATQVADLSLAVKNLAEAKAWLTSVAQPH